MINKEFARIIKKAKKDLGIECTYIEWTFRSNLKKCSGYWEHIYGNYYHIVVDSTQDETEIIKTILHELRHIWQHYTRTFIILGNKDYVWKGSRVKGYANIRSKPWEVDATAYEDNYVKYIPVRIPIKAPKGIQCFKITV